MIPSLLIPRALLVWLLLIAPASARTTELALDGQHLVDRWSVEDGLPLNHLRDVALSDEGYIWLATLDGLVRFDGVEMRSFRRSQHPELPSNRFVAVDSAPGGRLWLTTEDGSVLALDGEGHPGSRFTRWTPDAQGSLYEHLFSAADAAWVYGPGVVARLDADGPTAASGLPGSVRPEVLLEVGEELWIGTAQHGVLVLGPDLVVRPHRTIASEGFVKGLIRAADGVVYMGTSEGLLAGRPGGEFSLVSPPGLEGVSVCELLYTDRLWVRDTEGWWTLGADGYELLERHQSLSCRGRSRVIDGEPWRMVGDRVFRGRVPVAEPGVRLSEIVQGDSGLWLATDGSGLMQLRRRLVDTVEPPLGASAPWTLLVDRDQRIWVGDYQGVIYRVTDDGSRPTAHWQQQPPISETSIPAMMQAPDGALWFATIGGVCVQREQTCAPVALDGLGITDKTVARVIFSDSRGGVWIGYDHELLHRAAGQRTFQAVRGPDGSPLQSVAALAESSSGDIWAGTRGSGLLRLRDGQVRRWSRDEGLSSATLRAVWVSPEDEVWVGTEDAGLCHLAPPYEAPPSCLGAADGLYDDAIHSLLPDDQDRLWMSTNRGLTWAALSSLRAFVDGEIDSVFTVGLTERDGMLNREANGGASPAASRDALGRLWFPTQRGLAVVAPRDIREPSPPAPVIEQLTVDGEETIFQSGDSLYLSQDARLLEVRWTAPEFFRPEQLRFRYRLVGLDGDWRGPTDQHTGSWTNLPPGQFRLEVQAGLGELWSEEVVTLDIERPPSFRETPAFLAVIGLSGLSLGAVWALWRAGVRRRRELQLEELVNQRTEELERQTVVLKEQHAEIAEKSARLEELDALRTRLIADLSHELRTPLTLVVGPLEDLAASGEIPEGEATTRLDVIRRNTQRLEVLVEQLLDLARLESGQLRIRVRRHGLVAFVRQVSRRFEARCTHEGLDLRLQLPDREHDLWFDADLLDKVLSNLLVNAVKFTPEGGCITLRVSALPDEDGEAQQVQVDVQDTGVGIPPEQQQRLFERFEQGEQGDARRHGGVGIGLALARDLVQLHGGDIGVDSLPGLGSRFWFRLPLGVDHLSPDDIDLEGKSTAGVDDSDLLSVTLPVPEDPAHSQARVLVVEDHPDMRDFLVAHLRRRFTVEAAADGLAALALARAQPPDVIVSDVMMPDMDGLTLCRRLREEPSLAAVPVLLASAKSSEQDRIAGLEVADDYMTKPLRMRELLARVSKLVARSRSAWGGGGEVAAEGEVVEEPTAPALSEVDQALLDRLEATIAAHMGESSFGVAQLSKAMAYSRRQLLREVRRLCDESPSDLLRARRMTHGRDLLERGAVRTVAEAAHQVGLSPAYFSRTFSAWYGQTPREVLAGTSED